MSSIGNDDGPSDGEIDAIEWERLRAEARQAATLAYAPYSQLRVGSAGLGVDGQLVAGCNVENASFGLTLCAECGLVSAARLADVQLVAVSVQSGDGQVLMPCGRCRQLLLEVAGPALWVDAAPTPLRLEAILPLAFARSDLPTQHR